MNLKVVEKLQLGRLATPLPDRRRPVYNWLPMKESFCRDLVGLLAETWRLEDDLVLDPFCGVGTTPLACKELGINCVGYDVHSVMLFASRVKLRDYDVTGLRESIDELLGSKLERRDADVPGFVARVFPKPVLDDICSFRRIIMGVEDEATREFMLLGLANAAIRCSWAHKDGAAVKVVKRHVPPLGKALKGQLMQMCHDVEHFSAKPSDVRIEHCDVREMKLEDESVDAVITSPPYLRKQEYIHAHRIEQWVMELEGPHDEDIIGFRSGDVTEEDFSQVSGLKVGPLEAKAYFKDMYAAIKELYRVCRHGANVCLVTSDGCSPEGAVEVCIPLSELAEKAGFRAKKVVVVNKRHCTTPARKKVGIAREALLFWGK